MAFSASQLSSFCPAAEAAWNSVPTPQPQNPATVRLSSAATTPSSPATPSTPSSNLHPSFSAQNFPTSFVRPLPSAFAAAAAAASSPTSYFQRGNQNGCLGSQPSTSSLTNQMFHHQHPENPHPSSSLPPSRPNSVRGRGRPHQQKKR